MSPPRQTPSPTRTQTAPAQTQPPIATQILPSGFPSGNPPIGVIVGVAGGMIIIAIVVTAACVTFISLRGKCNYDYIMFRHTCSY